MGFLAIEQTLGTRMASYGLENYCLPMFLILEL